MIFVRGEQGGTWAPMWKSEDNLCGVSSGDWPLVLRLQQVSGWSQYFKSLLIVRACPCSRAIRCFVH